MVNGEITTIANKFKESLNPLRIDLFGSYARGDYNAKSDLLPTTMSTGFRFIPMSEQ